MKTILLFTLLLSAIAVFADDEKVLTTNISNVTVFLSGAQVERTGTIYMNAGNYDVVIQDLPTTINPNTIQVSGKGNITVLSVESRINYLKSQIKPKVVLVLEDSLELLRGQINYQNAMLTVYNSEETMILANKEIGGNDNGVDIAALKANADFYRVRLTDIKTKQLEIAVKLAKLNKEITRIQLQLNELNAKQNQPSGEIVVRVLANAAGNATFVTRYNVQNAGWAPMYDIRATDFGNPVKLTFKAGIYQSTGENWDKVKLVLSTANPNQSNDKPVLSPWYLYYNNYTYKNKYANDRAAVPMSAMETKTEATGGYYDEEKEFESAVAYTTVTEYPINFEYVIDLPYSVESNGKARIVQVKEYELAALYQYYSAPKLDNDAFLLARVTGWEKFNLLPGESNVFFQDTYVGKSYVNPLTALDTLEVSLGRDKSISIKREMIKDYTSDKFIGTSRKVTKGWEITVRNNKSKEIEIVVDDQFPITTNKEIEIEMIEYSGGTIEEGTGKVSWNLKLKPGETKKLTIKYSVKYPKDQNIIVY
ncbi:hypothetical protein SDC9_48688 [bioreactor metagenome]|uniref:DUF4139 domain-containing protein n=1 Tax=bioreactor metagenome TaxID=1076179 RepID=A0A644WFQ6_9ZZZZ